MEREPVVVIGAGPGGLAVAAALGERGVEALVLDGAPGVGSSWRGHYDRLRLHTPRRWSGLPGLPIPRRYGRWVAREDVVAYLEQYAAHHRLRLRLRSRARRVVRGEADSRLVVELEDGTRIGAEHVVLATGYNHTPVDPGWPGQDDFSGELTFARDYRNGRPYAGRDVLVVGSGNTGMEIATDLAEHGATRVWLAVRTAPHILPRSRLGWPAQATGILVRRLPPRLVDRVAGVLAVVQEPDLTDRGLPKPTTGLYSEVLRGRVPVQDVGIVSALRQGAVQPVAAVERLEGPDVVLADGTRIAPGAVIVATGYTAGLEGLVGELHVLNERGLPVVHGAHEVPGLPGLWFTGFTNPISGMLRELRIDAQRIAREIASQGDELSRAGASSRG
ncbi:MAG: NAD(P)/FAD-dependent oxidoreductase [Ornithinibacter sp.]